MKIAKRFMTLALATALGVGCATVGVSAAGSRTNAITVSDEQSAIYGCYVVDHRLKGGIGL